MVAEFSQLLCHRDPEQWFFFIPRQESEARGGRPNRLTSAGYWKATGCPGLVYSSNNRPVGEKRTMVFYTGRAPNGRKTEWKMNEYKAIAAEASTSSSDATSRVVWSHQLCSIAIIIIFLIIRFFNCQYISFFSSQRIRVKSIHHHWSSSIIYMLCIFDLYGSLWVHLF